MFVAVQSEVAHGLWPEPPVLTPSGTPVCGIISEHDHEYEYKYESLA